MSKPYISYIDPKTMKDAAMLAELERCKSYGTPRPESQAIRAHVPAVFWSFANSWRDVFHTGIADHGIKELCRLYVSRSVLCEFCGNQRSIKAAKAGAVIEDQTKDLINFENSSQYSEKQKAALSYAEAITWDLPVDQKFWDRLHKQFSRAGAGRDRLLHRADDGPAALAAHAQHRAPPDPGRRGRLDGAGLRDRGRAEEVQGAAGLLGEEEAAGRRRRSRPFERALSSSCPALWQRAAAAFRPRQSNGVRWPATSGADPCDARRFRTAAASAMRVRARYFPADFGSATIMSSSIRAPGDESWLMHTVVLAGSQSPK